MHRPPIGSFFLLLVALLISCGGGGSGATANDANASTSAGTVTGTASGSGTGAVSSPGSGTVSGSGSGSGTTTPSSSSAPSTLILTLPTPGLDPANLAVLVAQGDSISESIASYYQSKRGIPAANIIRVKLPTTGDSMSSADFATLKASIDALLPSNIQATLITWSAPSRVAGSCSMGITSAMAFGYDPKYCGSGCAVTAASAYFDSESSQPWSTHSIRPSMLLGAATLAAATTLIDRGTRADASYPSGDGYLLRTSDAARSVRYPDYAGLPSRWPGSAGLQLSYQDNSAGTSSDVVLNKSNLLFYFTGLTQVSGIASNSFRPGAVADHLTSFGGYLPGGNGQMPITTWLSSGATASYGTVEEPCNYTQKFSRASVLIDHYFRGDTLIEAYWKSVQWPGQGLFVGEPLAQPFRDAPSFTIQAGQYVISTRALRPYGRYALEYRTASSATWTTLAAFVGSYSQSTTLNAPLPPGNATQIRWTGPCAQDATQQCTLSTSR